ncbi:hypothetical protein [Pseudoalteromonas sp. Ps84H-4]|uniref:hypothetical protein n=1 Tax=Pseudoalteromonas sp. Ps84H-4 TaxID=2954502 RepID=UPI0020984D4D|nr:hypothetical protein [Pseudoalteromonas sp. Ps84H-4]MCO7249901.1 hypothetical protein [Pseudoalteromonas sp. Ps84H-4]
MLQHYNQQSIKSGHHDRFVIYAVTDNSESPSDKANFSCTVAKAASLSTLLIAKNIALTAKLLKHKEQINAS